MKIPIQFSAEERWETPVIVKFHPSRMERVNYDQARSRKRTKKHFRKEHRNYLQ
jgi:hypothetical protein